MVHKIFDFKQLGGFPVNQQRLEYMQESYGESITAICNLIGDNIIVTGCDVVEATISDGWVIVGGELLPFKGGAPQTTCIVRQTATPLEFSDASMKSVQLSRYCEFGGGVGSIEWTAIKRMPRIIEVAQTVQIQGETIADNSYDIDSLETKLNQLEQRINKMVLTYEVSGYTWESGKTEILMHISNPFPSIDLRDYMCIVTSSGETLTTSSRIISNAASITDAIYVYASRNKDVHVEIINYGCSVMLIKYK